MVTGHPYLETKHWERNIIIHMWCVYIIYYIILYYNIKLFYIMLYYIILYIYIYTVYKYMHPDMFSNLRSSDSDIFHGISSDTYSDMYHISWHFFCQILSHILWNADSVWHFLTFVLTSILHIQILSHLSYHIYDIYHISWHFELDSSSVERELIFFRGSAWHHKSPTVFVGSTPCQATHWAGERWPYLVGGFNLPLKNISSSVGMIIPYITEH